MAKPLVCYLIPCYNPKAPWIQECIISIQAQTVPWMAVLCDDGSTDPQIWNHLELYSHLDQRIICIKQKNQGVASALNACLAEGVKYEKVTHYGRLDIDDWNEPTRIEKQLKIMKAYDAGLCGTGMVLHQVINYNDVQGNCNPMIDEDPKELIRQGKTPCYHPTWLVRKECMQFYTDKYPHAEDIEWLCRYLSNNGKIVNHPEYLVHKRQHPNRVSALFRDIQRESHKRAVQEVLK